jgi:hypothetical protein
LFLKTDGAGNLSFSSDLPTTSFTGATVETSIADSDLVLIYDDSATAVRKMTKANLVAGIGASAGQVIQVVQGTSSTSVTSATSTQITTGLTASITPSSSANKILILIVQQGLYVNSPNMDINFNLHRHANGTAFSTGTNILGIDAYYGYTTASESKSNMVTNLLHSPSTTSNTAFTLTFARNRGSGTVECNNNSAFSSITLMEVKG